MIEHISIDPGEFVRFAKEHLEHSVTRVDALDRWVREHAVVCADSSEWLKSFEDHQRKQVVQLSVGVSDWAFSGDGAEKARSSPLNPFAWESTQRERGVRALAPSELRSMVRDLAKYAGELRIIDRYGATGNQKSGRRKFFEELGAAESLASVQFAVAHRFKDDNVMLDRDAVATRIMQDASAIMKTCDVRVFTAPNESFIKHGHDRFIAGYDPRDPSTPRWCFLIGAGIRALGEEQESLQAMVAPAHPNLFVQVWTRLGLEEVPTQRH